VLLLAAVLQGSAACDVPNMTACSQASAAEEGQCRLSGDKKECCLGVAQLEGCILSFGAGCAGPAVTAVKNQVEVWREYLTATLGIECQEGLGTPTTTVQLMSGDSGSASGSGRSALSGSSSGLMIWQWVLFVLFFCCCLGGGGGGAYMAMGKGKKRGKAKGGGSRAYDDEMPTPVPVEQEMPPMATDPQLDMSQVPMLAEQQSDLPPLEEIVQVPEVEPLLFGPTPGLLPGPTASTIVGGGSYSQYSYPMAVPQTQSNYTQGFYQPAQQPIYQTSVINAAPEMVFPSTTSAYNDYGGAYGAFGTQPLGTIPPAGFYAQAAPPQYATTAYSGGGVI